MTTATHDQASAARPRIPANALEADGASTSWRVPASTAISGRRADTSRESSPARRLALEDTGPAKQPHGPEKGILGHVPGYVFRPARRLSQLPRKRELADWHCCSAWSQLGNVAK